MQHYFHLNETGEPDDATLEVMHQPRCGVPDVAEYKTTGKTKKWDTNNLTYRLVGFRIFDSTKNQSYFLNANTSFFSAAQRVNNFTTDIDRETILYIIAAAFKAWSDCTPLTFTLVTNRSAHIEIWFSVGGKDLSRYILSTDLSC